MAVNGRGASSVWHRLAQPEDHRGLMWDRFPAVDSTRWAVCGRSWDAVAITPMALGVRALAALRIIPERGYPVLADHLRNRLYVLVPPGTGSAAAGIEGVRVLSDGHQLLVPASERGTLVAHWINPPRSTSPPLVRADHLADQLNALANAEPEEPS